MMPNKKNMIIGVTGNSGSGKTTVCDMLTYHGGYSINTDAIAHKVMKPGQPGYKKIVVAFGPDILSENEIDRKKLGSVVFSDIQKRTLLEKIVHPLVTDDILEQIRTVDADFFVIDAVLLVESGLHKHCDYVWLITAPEEARLSRIITRDNLDNESAMARMRNQRDTSPIAAIAQEIISNDGDLESLESQIQTAISLIL